MLRAAGGRFPILARFNIQPRTVRSRSKWLGVVGSVCIVSLWGLSKEVQAEGSAEGAHSAESTEASSVGVYTLPSELRF